MRYSCCNLFRLCQHLADFVKGQIINVLDFVSLTVSIVTIQLVFVAKKVAKDIM